MLVLGAVAEDALYMNRSFISAEYCCSLAPVSVKAMCELITAASLYVLHNSQIAWQHFSAPEHMLVCFCNGDTLCTTVL